MDFFKQFAATIIVTLILVTLVVLGFKSYIDTPDVYVSHSSGECMKVLPQGSCDSLPSRYNTVFVK